MPRIRYSVESSRAFLFYNSIKPADSEGDERIALIEMRLCYKMCVCLISSIVLLSSCIHSGQEDSQTINDSLIEREPDVIPLREININGKWESKDNPLYPILEFKGKSTVLITTILGQMASGYERDEEFIRVRTDKSDLLFEIVTEDSIIGSGFAKGVWIKEK